MRGVREKPGGTPSAAILTPCFQTDMKPAAPSMTTSTAPTFQELILRLNHYWAAQGCVLVQPLEEADSALRWLDTFYAEPTEGFGRKGGLCVEGRLNDRAITAYLVGGFLASRGAGDSYDASIAAMRAQIVKTDDYRAVHPELATPLPAVK